MKRLALVALLLLAGCGKQPIPANSMVVPSHFCTQTPNGEVRTDTRAVYCGRGCYRQQEFKQYGVEVACKFIDWREE